MWLFSGEFRIRAVGSETSYWSEGKNLWTSPDSSLCVCTHLSDWWWWVASLHVYLQTGGKASQRMKKRPPRGMFLNQQDVVSLSSSSPQGLIRQLDSQLVSIKRQVSVVMEMQIFTKNLLLPMNSWRSKSRRRADQISPFIKPVEWKQTGYFFVI